MWNDRLKGCGVFGYMRENMKIIFTYTVILCGTMAPFKRIEQYLSLPKKPNNNEQNDKPAEILH